MLAVFIILGFAFCQCNYNSSNVIDIDYLGQTPPGNTAVLFAPGIVSTDDMEHSAPAFSPDGTIVLWTVIPDGFSKPAFFLESNYENGQWSKPHRPSFNDSTADDYYPSFSVDGQTLFFSSRRKLPEGYTQGGDMRIWQIDRNGRTWGTPLPLDTMISRGREFAHSETKDGGIYFSAGYFNDELNGKTGWSIYTTSDTSNKSPQRMPYSINSMGYEDGPYVAPDESYLIFESDRPAGMGGTDLYISFKNEEHRWTIPINMGSAINTSFSERFARVSPDGKYLFFGSSKDEREGHPGFDIYWIDASIIDQLRNSKLIVSLDNELGDELLKALDDGNWADAEVLCHQWLKSNPSDADAVFNYAVVLKKQQNYAEAEKFLARNASLFKANPAYVLEMALLNIALSEEEAANQMLAPLLADERQSWNRYVYLSNALFDMNKFEASDAYFNKAMALNMWNYGYYKRACSYAHKNEKSRSFENLQLAIKNGFNNKQHFETDPSLDGLKHDARWEQLLGSLQ